MAIVYKSVLNSEPYPNGKTITPIDNVTIWLICGSIRGKFYISIDDVLNDTTTLNDLMASNNAVDYLVRCSTFVLPICSNEDAMTAIGNSDYAASTLINNSMWFDAICQSPYINKILVPLVPTMTSNTAPSGVVNQSSYFSSNLGYKAFDNNTEVGWSTVANGLPGWVSYTFDETQTIYAFALKPANDAGCIKKFILQGSNDNSEWADLFIGNLNNEHFPLIFYSVYGTYKSFRLYIETSYLNWTGISFLQFYGRA